MIVKLNIVTIDLLLLQWQSLLVHNTRDVGNGAAAWV